MKWFEYRVEYSEKLICFPTEQINMIISNRERNIFEISTQISKYIKHIHLISIHLRIITHCKLLTCYKLHHMHIVTTVLYISTNYVYKKLLTGREMLSWKSDKWWSNSCLIEGCGCEAGDIGRPPSSISPPMALFNFGITGGLDL